MASLVKVNSKYYLDFYDPTRAPKRKRVALRVSTKREAEKLKAQLEYGYASGTSDPWRPRAVAVEPAPPPPPAPAFATVQQAEAAFQASRTHRTAATRRTYRDIVGRFVASLPDDLPLTALTAADIERWLDQTPAGDVTRRTYTKHLSTFCRFCVAAGALDSDVTSGVRLRRVPRRFPKALTPQEVARLLGAIERGPASTLWLRDVVEFTVHTALRRGEVVALRWGAVDVAAGVLTVACDDHFQTKSGAERRMPLAGPALDVLRRLQAERRVVLGWDGKGEHVFRHRRGPLNPDYLSQRFALAARRAGLDGATFHGLRHTAITRLIERGVPLPVVQRFAGHADVATTMRYCSLADDVYAAQVRSALAA